jgi:hypothetical protein
MFWFGEVKMEAPGRYRINRPFLDELGSIYVAGYESDGSCVRLNRSAGNLWREIDLRNRVAPHHLEIPSTREWLLDLLARDVIRHTPEG